MKVPQDLNVHICNNCKAQLADRNFVRTGVNVTKHQFFFDYFCESCSFVGSYILAINATTSVGEALKNLGEACIGAEKQTPDPKGNVKELLNRIVGVQDLLNLGGNDAPREFSRDDDPSDLP